MTNVLLIIAIIMLLVTMIASVITASVIISESKSKELIFKVLKVISIVLVVALVIGCAIGASFIKDDNNNDNTIETVSLTEAGFNEITVDEYLSLIKEPTRNVILIARPTCSYCEKFTPILKKASDDMNIVINYVDTDKLTEDTMKSFEASFDIFSEQWGTPLVIVTENGTLVAKNEGYTDLTTIKKFFSDNNLGE